MPVDTVPASDSRDRTLPHTLGEYDISVSEARSDDDFRVLDLPEDMVEEHLTPTYTPDRYAKLCRDVAYFTSSVGSAPYRNTGDGDYSPGSGMRRAKNGALYNLRRRQGLLERAITMDLIEITNEEGFDADESDWRFSIQPRGEWYLSHFYGDHVPVRHVHRKKLSRHSTVLNSDLTVVDPDDETVKSLSEYKEQVKSQEMGMGDIDTGHYHVDAEPVSVADGDAESETLVAWIDRVNMPEQYDISLLDRPVELRIDVPGIAADNGPYDPTVAKVVYDSDADVIAVESATGRSEVDVLEANDRKAGIDADYDPFVTSGAKDVLKEAVDASWSADYQRWYVPHEEFLAGCEAILTSTEVSEITIPVYVIDEYTEYL